MNDRNPVFVSSSSVRSVLRNQFLVIVGDSVMRGIYKDIVALLQNDDLLDHFELKSKGEFAFRGDKLIEGGKMKEMTNCIQYKEVRQYRSDFHLVRFYFVTRCFGEYIDTILKDFVQFPPDIVIMNSCLWDITRWGPSSVKMFEERLPRLFKALNNCLQPHCLFIWTSTLPVHTDLHGGFLVPEIVYKKHTLRLDIVEANWFAQKVCREFERDFFDLNYHIRDLQEKFQIKDGVHWNSVAHRHFSTYIISYIADSLRIPIEDNFVYTNLEEQDQEFATDVQSFESVEYPQNKSKFGPIRSYDVDFRNCRKKISYEDLR